jgi:hypothetical protein
MAHFAKVLDGKVINVIVAEPEFFETFIDSSPGDWIQTSYNTRGGIHYVNGTDNPSQDQSKSLRKNFAIIGGNYDKTKDAFYHKQPYPSWILNETTCFWEPPVPIPDDVGPESEGKHAYLWDEETKTWEQVSET